MVEWKLKKNMKLDLNLKTSKFILKLIINLTKEYEKIKKLNFQHDFLYILNHNL